MNMRSTGPTLLPYALSQLIYSTLTINFNFLYYVNIVWSCLFLCKLFLDLYLQKLVTFVTCLLYMEMWPISSLMLERRLFFLICFFSLRELHYLFYFIIYNISFFFVSCTNWAIVQKLNKDIIIIIIIRHEVGLMDLFRPRLIVSSQVFQVVFVHFVDNSTLFLVFCCCSFLLHIVANLICIFLASRLLVPISALPKVFIPFLGIKVCTRLFF
jgi:hypothetical protein